MSTRESATGWKWKLSIFLNHCIFFLTVFVFFVGRIHPGQYCILYSCSNILIIVFHASVQVCFMCAYLNEKINKYIYNYIYIHTYGPVSRVHGPPPTPCGMGGYPPTPHNPNPRPTPHHIHRGEGYIDIYAYSYRHTYTCCIHLHIHILHT